MDNNNDAHRMVDDRVVSYGKTSQFLLFRIGDEIYGTPALDAQEIIEPQDYQHVPNTIPSFLGMINLHGRIVGSIDLARQFGVKKSSSEKERLIVFEVMDCALAALVDEIISIVDIPLSDIDREPPVATLPVSARFLVGIAKYDQRLVTLIELDKVLAEKELISMKITKMTG